MAGTMSGAGASLPILIPVKLKHAMGGLTGWRSWLAAFMFGASATLALPPVNAWPVLMLVVPMLIWMLQGDRSRKSTFAIGWWFGFGFLASGLYWISHALLIFSDRLLWMVPFAALGLPAFLAFYTGGVALALRWFRHPVIQVLAFVPLWVMGEWLRGMLFTGFPWNLIGYAWAGSDALIQSASLVGAYGLSFLVLAMAVLPALLPLVSRRVGGLLLVGMALLPMAVYGYGFLRLENAELPAETTNAISPNMRIVQPAIPQKEKWSARYRARNFTAFLQLTQAGRGNGIHTVIWPETAAAFFLEEVPQAREAIAQALPENGILITGAPRRDAGAGTLHNSGLVLNAEGRVIEAYDKSHLVPFGEYVPLRSVLPVEKVAHGMSDYTPGPGPRTIHIPGVPPVSILICYEAVFPGQVTNGVQRPDWMLNLTNDAWYGRTAGPYQHLAIVRTRAVEEGLPMVRAASTGVSAVFDSFGREMGRLALDQSGYLDFVLPEPIEGGTIYSRTGNGLMILLIAAILGMLVVANNRLDSKQL